MLEFLFGNIWTIMLVFIASLILLLKSADYFTESTEKLGLIMKIPQFIIGITIVSIGTSLPELATALIAVSKGTTEIVAANAVGSNIANLLLVVGVVALFAKRIKISWDIIQVDLPLLLGSAFILSFMAWDGLFTFPEAIVSIIGVLIYIYYVYSTHKEKKHEEREKIVEKEIKEEAKKIHKSIKKAIAKKRNSHYIKLIVITLLSVVGIYIGAEFLINSIIEASKLEMFLNFGIDTSIITITALAIGTSLPELMVTVSAAKRKNFEVAIGNVLGSNIFNSFAVMGIPALFGTLIISQPVITVGIPFMLAATFLYVISTKDKEISNHEGLMFLLVYLVFIAKLFNLF